MAYRTEYQVIMMTTMAMTVTTMYYWSNHDRVTKYDDWEVDDDTSKDNGEDVSGKNNNNNNKIIIWKNINIIIKSYLTELLAAAATVYGGGRIQ